MRFRGTVLVQLLNRATKWGVCMRNVLSLICVLGICCGSAAQTGRSSWGSLSGLKAGQKIQVIEMNSTKHQGTFLNVSDSAIAFREGAGEKSVQRADVRSVTLMGRHRRLRNTLIGLGVGAGAGAVIGAGATPSGDKGYVAAFLGVAGGFCGTVVGVLLPTHDTIYRVGSN